LTEGVILTQVSSNEGISVYWIMWGATNCHFMSSLSELFWRWINVIVLARNVMFYWGVYETCESECVHAWSHTVALFIWPYGRHLHLQTDYKWKHERVFRVGGNWHCVKEDYVHLAVITFAFYAGCGMHKEGHNVGNFLPH